MNVARHGRELGQRRVRRHRLNIAGGGSGPPPSNPFVFVSGFKAVSIFGSRQGEVVVAGGTPPYTSVSVPFNNGGINIPTSPVAGTGRFTWTGLSETMVLLTVSDSAGASIQVNIDYTGMGNDSNLPLVPVAPSQPIDITNPDLFPQDTPGKIAAFAYSHVWVEDFGGPSEFGYIIVFQTDVSDDVRSITADQGMPTEAALVEGSRGNANAFWVYKSPSLTPGADHIFTLSSPGLPTQTFLARVPAGGLKVLETRPSSACYFMNFGAGAPMLRLGVAEPPGASSGGIDLWAAENLDGLNAMGALGVGAERNAWPGGVGLMFDRPSDWESFNGHWDGALWQLGKAPLPTGTHTLTVLGGGNDVGFVAGNYGAIAPTTLNGLTITEMREHWDGTDSSLFLTLGGQKIPGIDKVAFVQKSEGLPAVDLVWNAANSQYTATVAPAPLGGYLINFFSQDVQIDLLPDAPAFHPVNLFASGEEGALLEVKLGQVYQDDAGLVPVTAASQRVKRINDQSGNGAHAVVTTDPNAPTYQVGDVVRFDGATSRLNSNVIDQTKSSVITVATIVKSAAVGGGVFSSGRTGVGSFSVDFNANGFTVRSRGSLSSNSIQLVTPDKTKRQGLIAELNMQSTISGNLIGGPPVASNAQQGAAGEKWVSNGLEIMGRTNNSGFVAGDLIFIMVINRALTATEKTDLTNWMAELIAKAVPSNDLPAEPPLPDQNLPGEALI